MISDEIKASIDYSNYLEKSMRDKPVKGKGKGLLTRKGVEVAVQKIETIRVPKKKRIETFIKETTPSKEVADTIHKELDEEALDHSKKLKGVETISAVAQYLLDMKIATKESKNEYILQQRLKGLGEGLGVIPEVPGEPSDHSGSSNDKARNVQAKVSEPELQVEKPVVQLLNSSLTLSFAEYGNQFINDNPDISVTDVLKEPVEAEVQSLVDVLASCFFLDHEKHLTLYNALINLMDVDEANVQGNKDTKKRRHDKQDPPTDANKDSKKGKRKDANTSSSKKGKTQSKSSKEAKAPTEPSATDKVVEDDDVMVQDDDLVNDEMPHDDDDAPTQDRSKCIELEYNMEQCYLALTNLIDWVNPEGDRCLYDLSKPLPLQGKKEKKYAVSLTKPKAAQYDLKGLEEMIPKLWSPTNKKEYTFNEADFKRLHLNDIEDMLLLIVLKYRVEDVQLRVESYQMKHNVTIPQLTCLGKDDGVTTSIQLCHIHSHIPIINALRIYVSKMKAQNKQRYTSTNLIIKELLQGHQDYDQVKRIQVSYTSQLKNSRIKDLSDQVPYLEELRICLLKRNMDPSECALTTMN
ncbi:hypothetical protein Tco_0268100 [Tanacetum coccineum]